MILTFVFRWGVGWVFGVVFGNTQPYSNPVNREVLRDFGGVVGCLSEIIKPHQN